MKDRPTPFHDLTDQAVLAELGGRLARHRLRRNLTQAELAHEAGVSLSTVSRLEAGESTQLTNLIRVVRALGLLGNFDVFVPPPAPSPIELLEMQGRQRRRASPRTREEGNAVTGEPWTWDEPTARGGDHPDGAGGPESADNADAKRGDAEGSSA